MKTPGEILAESITTGRPLDASEMQDAMQRQVDKLAPVANIRVAVEGAAITPGQILAHAARTQQPPDLEHLRYVMQQRIDEKFPDLDIVISVRGIEELPKRAADRDGHAGVGWRVVKRAESPANLATWIVCVPGAHPFWSWWMVSVVTLRDLPGLPPANRKYPEAEYEFMIAAIDAKSCPSPDPDNPPYPPLLPLDVVEHFHGLSEDEAAALCERAVEAIVRGDISPDQDFRAAWKSFIGAIASAYAGSSKAFREL